MSARRGETAAHHTVPFHDVDITGRVWHGNYLKYFEIARSALFRAHGLEDAKLIPGQFALYVVESRCRHTAPLHYGDELRAVAWFREATHALSIDYEVVNVTTGKRAATGYTKIAATDREGRLLLRLPDSIRERIEEISPAP